MVNQEITRLTKATSSPITGGGGGSTVAEATTPIGPAQVWNLTVAEPPAITTWDATSYQPGDGFNTFAFNVAQFNPLDPVFTAGSPTLSYDDSTNILSIDWGSTKTGYITVLTLSTGGFSVIAVAES